jgi:uncharacterized protein YjbI with pentapeptide repeats
MLNDALVGNCAHWAPPTARAYSWSERPKDANVGRASDSGVLATRCLWISQSKTRHAAPEFCLLEDSANSWGLENQGPQVTARAAASRVGLPGRRGIIVAFRIVEWEAVMAGFCCGFAFEQDVPEPSTLTIEGRPVEGFKETRVGGRAYAKLPSGGRITAPSVRALVRRYVKRTGALASRNAARVTALHELNKNCKRWNEWRRRHPDVHPMLACARSGVDIRRQNLDCYDFSYANLCEAQLQGVWLRNANFHQAILAGANLSGARLEGANFCRTDLYKTKFTNAHLKGANLQGVQLAYTDLTGADLRDCTVYGMSAWDLKLEETNQQELIIRYQPSTKRDEKEQVLRVHGLNAAAFMYFALHNPNISTIIDAAADKWVLILGRFTEGRDVLNKVRDALEKDSFIPVIFDFERPKQRDLIETIILLAGMSAFVIVEMSNPRSVALELQVIASSYGVPIFPIIKKGAKPFGMFSGLRKFRWVSRPVEYKTTSDLIARLRNEVIRPAMKERHRLAAWKRRLEELSAGAN